jgi:hypothetical protein
MTTKIAGIQEQQPSRSVLKNLLWVTPLAMFAGAAANLGLYAAAGRLYPEVTAWSGAGPGQIVGANIVYLFIGTIVFALVARFSSRPARHYWIVATVGLLLSLGLPISVVPAAGVATAVTLSLMHVVSFAISVPLFIRLALD